MNENKFWLSLWAIVGIVIISIASMITYNQKLSDEIDLKMAKKGLHKYKVERCIALSTYDEWHKAGWKNKR